MNGPRIFIKRDDQTGLALGGNKTRKLEYLLGDALKQEGVDTLITADAPQSNHCRQTAAAAQLGLRCELLLKGPRPEKFEGNILLDYLLGAHLHWTMSSDIQMALIELAEKIRHKGHKPYIIPFGGSNAIGALGYISAMVELMTQIKKFPCNIDYIIFASCSGATQVGLQMGADVTNFLGKVIGISIDSSISKKNEFQKMLTQLANETSELLHLSGDYNRDVFSVNYDYANGYGRVGELERDAILQLARCEGILLDPVYTGRAFGGLIDMINKNFFKKNETILFWHTGGSTALFPYANNLIKNQ